MLSFLSTHNSEDIFQVFVRPFNLCCKTNSWFFISFSIKPWSSSRFFCNFLLSALKFTIIVSVCFHFNCFSLILLPIKFIFNLSCSSCSLTTSIHNLPHVFKIKISFHNNLSKSFLSLFVRLFHNLLLKKLSKIVFDAHKTCSQFISHCFILSFSKYFIIFSALSFILSILFNKAPLNKLLPKFSFLFSLWFKCNFDFFNKLSISLNHLLNFS